MNTKKFISLRSQMWPLTSFQVFLIYHGNITHTLASWVLYAFFDASSVCLVRDSYALSSTERLMLPTLYVIVDRLRLILLPHTNYR